MVKKREKQLDLWRAAHEKDYQYKVFYPSKEWNKLSKEVRNSTEDKWCRECLKEGEYVRSEIADHIIPIGDPRTKEDPGLLLNRINIQGLCRPHHQLKTKKERPWNKKPPPPEDSYKFL